MQFILEFLKPYIWQNLYKSMQGPDWFTVLFVIVGIFYGMRKGLMRELVEIFEFVVIIFLTFAYLEIVVSILSNSLSIPSEKLAPVAFVLGAWVIWMAVAYLDKTLQKLLVSKLPEFIKTLGGTALGVIHLLLIWSFLSQAIILIPSEKTKEVYAEKKSLTGAKVRDLAPRVYRTVADYIHLPGSSQKGTAVKP